ncbi:hypothetical protein D0867_05009 [Hortaea werneckii]|uniref:Protein kinase domain-containing protein n=1 Tax=Hortaea werneckii TaxID=91943 RepID=A0A3M7BB77_HORWE|nr:hypothetical protein D0868_10668 [Hortaea werneckii]RMY18921.1 hypothetical protein D0867_05009 [Hortaea werneckii]RMY36924.1 hypothetical protein D0866_03600 [Hortaea werneckii]
MASTFCVGQVVRGRKGLYRITQKLHHQVWGASCAAHDHIVLKCAYPKRVQREKEVLQRFEGHANIKPDNILLNYGQEGTTVVEAKLADYGDAYEADLTRHPHGAAHVIGAGIFRSPEVLLGLHLSTSTDIWSFGATLISLLWGRGFHIFKPVAGVTADDAEFPAHVLMEQARYFGPFPLRYQELLDEESESILAAIHVLIEQEGTRKPFLLVEDEEIQLEDKEFLCDIMRLDPLERPTASDLLKHRWFDVL